MVRGVAVFEVVGSKRALMSALLPVLPVVGGSSKMPVLANCLMVGNAELDSVVVSGTSLDKTITHEALLAVGTVRGSGEVCVGARRLMGVLGQMPEGRISLGVENGELVVRAKKAGDRGIRVGLPVMPVEVFPRVSRLLRWDRGNVVRFSSFALMGALSRVGFCAGDSSCPVSVRGCYLRWKGGVSFEVFATDTRRCARTTFEDRSWGCGGEPGDCETLRCLKEGVLIPSGVFGVLSSLDVHDGVEFALSSGVMLIRQGPLSVGVTLYPSQYLDPTVFYEPTGYHRVEIDGVDFKGALVRACRHLLGCPRGALRFYGDRLEVSVGGVYVEGVGYARETPVRGLCVSMNLRYLSEFVGRVSSVVVTLLVRDGESRVMMFDECGDYVLMPMQ